MKWSIEKHIKKSISKHTQDVKMFKYAELNPIDQGLFAVRHGIGKIWVCDLSKPENRLYSIRFCSFCEFIDTSVCPHFFVQNGLWRQ